MKFEQEIDISSGVTQIRLLLGVTWMMEIFLSLQLEI